MNEEFMNPDRVRELWTAIKAELAKKPNMSDLDSLASTTAVATAIATALAPYSTTEQVQKLISDQIHLQFEVVEQLPAVAEASETTIYLLKVSGATGDDSMDEYVLVNDINGTRFEKLGSTRIDLTNYWTKDDLRAITSDELKAILV